MKFSVSSSALLSLLATTGKVISNKNTLPIRNKWKPCWKEEWMRF